MLNYFIVTGKLFFVTKQNAMADGLQSPPAAPAVDVDIEDDKYMPFWSVALARSCRSSYTDESSREKFD